MINNLSIVFRVKGSELTERPYMLCAHLDVVPEGEISQWDCDEIHWVHSNSSGSLSLNKLKSFVEQAKNLQTNKDG